MSGGWSGTVCRPHRTCPTGAGCGDSEGLDPDQVVQHHGAIGVVGPIVKLGHHPARILKVVKLALDLLLVLLILHSNRLGQVSEGGGVTEVQAVRIVVCQDPGKDGILGQVVVGPACHSVEMHQILKVGGLPVDPFLS